MGNPDVTIEVALDDTWDDSNGITNLSAVYAAATASTYVTYGYTATVSIGQNTDTVDLDNVRHGFRATPADAAKEAAQAAVAAVIKDEYSVSDESYKSWAKFQASVKAAIEAVDGITNGTVTIENGTPDFTDGTTEWKSGISFTLEYGFTCSNGGSGTQNVTGETKVISLVP